MFLSYFKMVLSNIIFYEELWELVWIFKGKDNAAGDNMTGYVNANSI